MCHRLLNLTFGKLAGHIPPNKTQLLTRLEHDDNGTRHAFFVLADFITWIFHSPSTTAPGCHTLSYSMGLWGAAIMCGMLVGIFWAL